MCTKEYPMSVVLNAVRIVLEEANEPLHSREITQRILARGLWRTEGKTPDETVSAQLSVDIINHAQASLFQRTGKGIFALVHGGCLNLIARLVGQCQQMGR